MDKMFVTLRMMIIMIMVSVLLSLVSSDTKTTESAPLTSSTLVRSSLSMSEDRENREEGATVRTRVKQEREQWPIREMIAILGELHTIVQSLKLRNIELPC